MALFVGPEEDRAVAQQRELVRMIDHHSYLGKFWDGVAIFLIIIGLIATTAASVSGFLGHAKASAIFALIPGFAAYFALAFKPEGRARWHHGRKNDLHAVRRRLLYQMPNPPTGDQLGLIAGELNKLDARHHEDAQKYFNIDWVLLKRSQRSDDHES